MQPGQAEKPQRQSPPAHYEAPKLVVIGPLARITLGSLSVNGDPGGNLGFRNIK